MGNILYAECDEYFLLFEYMQGNSFGGLLYDDLIEEDLAIDDSDYVVYVEEVSDSLSFASSLAPSHEPYCHIDDGFYLTSQFGLPVRAYQSALTVLHTCKVVPIDFCFMSVEVLHGVETYYEELSSGLYSVDFTAPANYVLETVYESYAIVFVPDMYIPEITVKYTLSTNDILNYMHDVSQDYYFNCLADDNIGLYPRMRFGYHVNAHSQWRMDSFAYNAIGKVADDYIMLDDDRAEINWNGLCLANEVIMLFEWLESHRGYDFLVESGLTGIDSIDTYYYMVHLVEDAFDLSGLTLSPTERHQFVADMLRTASIVAGDAHYNETVGSDIVIDEDTGIAHILFQVADDDLSVTEEV